MPKFATKIRAFGLLVGGFLLIQTWNNFEKMVHFCFLLLEKSAPLPIVTVVTNMSYVSDWEILPKIWVLV